MTSLYWLRRATDNDYNFLFQLHVDTIRPAVEATWGWDDVFQADYFRSHWSLENRQIIMAGDKEIGTITLEK